MPRRAGEVDARIAEYVNQLRWKWRLLRFRAGCRTVRAAADKTGLPIGLVAQIERADLNYMPTVETLVRLARGYEVSPEEMLTPRLPDRPFDHLGQDIAEWLDANPHGARSAWKMAMAGRFFQRDDLDAGERQEKIDLETARHSDIEIAAWAANPRNRDWLRLVRAVALLKTGAIDMDAFSRELAGIKFTLTIPGFTGGRSDAQKTKARQRRR